MSKFNFVLPKNWEECQDEIQSMSRVVSTIEIKDMIVDEMTICDVLKKFESQFKTLILLKITIDAHVFKQLVSIFRLDKLIVMKVKVIKTAFEPVKLDSDEEKVLSVIGFFRIDKEFLDTLIEMKLQCRKLTCRIDEDSVEETMFNTSFNGFMKQQTSLKELLIKIPYEEFHSGSVIDHLKSEKLHKLAIILTHINPSHHPEKDNCLAELIESQPDLKELEIDIECISEGVIDAIFKIQGLHTLRLAVHKLPLITRAVCPTQTNLKTFIFSSIFNCSESLDIMLKVFKSIENLYMECNAFETDEIVLLVQQRLKSLKYLKVEHMDHDFSSVTIPSLRKLQIIKLKSNEALCHFLAQNPLLQELEIKKNYDNDENVCYIDVPPKSINLKKLTLKSDSFTRFFVLGKWKIRELKARCPSLARITIVDRFGDRFISFSQKLIDYSPVKVVINSLRENDVFEKVDKMWSFYDYNFENKRFTLDSDSTISSDLDSNLECDSESDSGSD